MTTHSTNPPLLGTFEVDGEIHCNWCGQSTSAQGDRDRLSARVAELEAACVKASRTIAVLKTFCDVPLTVVRAAETEIEIDAAMRGKQ